jgi:hypothetical protein
MCGTPLLMYPKGEPIKGRESLSVGQEVICQTLFGLRGATITEINGNEGEARFKGMIYWLKFDDEDNQWCNWGCASEEALKKCEF